MFVPQADGVYSRPLFWAKKAMRIKTLSAAFLKLAIVSWTITSASLAQDGPAPTPAPGAVEDTFVVGLGFELTPDLVLQYPLPNPDNILISSLPIGSRIIRIAGTEVANLHEAHAWILNAWAASKDGTVPLELEHKDGRREAVTALATVESTKDGKRAIVQPNAHQRLTILKVLMEKMFVFQNAKAIVAGKERTKTAVRLSLIDGEPTLVVLEDGTVRYGVRESEGHTIIRFLGNEREPTDEDTAAGITAVDVDTAGFQVLFGIDEIKWRTDLREGDGTHQPAFTLGLESPDFRLLPRMVLGLNVLAIDVELALLRYTREALACQVLRDPPGISLAPSVCATGYAAGVEDFSVVASGRKVNYKQIGLVYGEWKVAWDSGAQFGYSLPQALLFRDDADRIIVAGLNKADQFQIEILDVEAARARISELKEKTREEAANDPKINHWRLYKERLAQLGESDESLGLLVELIGPAETDDWFFHGNVFPRVPTLKERVVSIRNYLVDVNWATSWRDAKERIAEIYGQTEEEPEKEKPYIPPYARSKGASSKPEPRSR